MVAAVLDAGRSTGIDLLLTITPLTESRFGANAESDIFGGRAVAILKANWLENLKKFGGKHGLSHCNTIHRSGVGLSCCTRSRRTEYRRSGTTRALLHYWLRNVLNQKERSKIRHCKSWTFTSSHALGVSGANRFIEAVSNRPSVPCAKPLLTLLGRFRFV